MINKTEWKTNDYTYNDKGKKIIKKERFIKKTILFSPCAASFDSFKNFEDRGSYFNKLIKQYVNGI